MAMQEEFLPYLNHLASPLHVQTACTMVFPPPVVAKNVLKGDTIILSNLVLNERVAMYAYLLVVGKKAGIEAKTVKKFKEFAEKNALFGMKEGEVRKEGEHRPWDTWNELFRPKNGYDCVSPAEFLERLKGSHDDNETMEFV